jgi:aspartyl-tRNA(Asn)/glutamyl-tRNA(Gln) amidotransferase subunit A
MDEIVYLDAVELAERIRTRELSPVEVVRAHRERAEAVNPALNAIVTSFEDAEERARAAESAVLAGDALGPLHGVPFTIKDAFDTAGVRTARGSRLFRDRVPDRDATVVARLRGAGGIPLGKTNTPEFALWWETDNLVFGRTANPWDPDRTAGGSSGGEASAIAAGLSPLGLGSDLGGSIRLPASHCGIVGLKPTHGRVPLTGHWPETILRFMHAGPMARTVRDIALALSIISGPDGRDWHCVPVAPPPAGLSESGVRGRRVGWLADKGFGAVEPEVAGAVAAAARALSAAGCDVEQVELPWLEAVDCNPLTMTLYGGEGTPYFGPLLAGREEELHPFVQARLGRPPAPLDEYLSAEATVEELRRDLAGYFEQHDVLLCPTVPAPAHAHGVPEVTIAGETVGARAKMRATIPFNLTGSPALTVPFARSGEGLPIGVQIVGRRFEETTVLEVGAALERARGPLPRPPL